MPALLLESADKWGQSSALNFNRGNALSDGAVLQKITEKKKYALPLRGRRRGGESLRVPASYEERYPYSSYRSSVLQLPLRVLIRYKAPGELASHRPGVKPGSSARAHGTDRCGRVSRAAGSSSPHRAGGVVCYGGSHSHGGTHSNVGRAGVALRRIANVCTIQTWRSPCVARAQTSSRT
ncbi:hypothetical protein VTO73DRAFT_12944 [Trametes versicolor]